MILEARDRRGGKAEFSPTSLAVNVMTWWLCGYECVTGTMALSSALARAKANLAKRIDVVGVTDDIGSFLVALKATVPFLAGVLPVADVVSLLPMF